MPAAALTSDSRFSFFGSTPGTLVARLFLRRPAPHAALLRACRQGRRLPSISKTYAVHLLRRRDLLDERRERRVHLVRRAGEVDGRRHRGPPATDDALVDGVP